MHRAHAPDPLIGADPTAGGTALPAGEPAGEEKLPPLTGMAELFHQLNNQLGIILANAELLEAKSADDMGRARAAQVVASVLDAMATAREIRLRSR
jgi:hypothetical protein